MRHLMSCERFRRKVLSKKPLPISGALGAEQQSMIPITRGNYRVFGGLRQARREEVAGLVIHVSGAQRVPGVARPQSCLVATGQSRRPVGGAGVAIAPTAKNST